MAFDGFLNQWAYYGSKASTSTLPIPTYSGKLRVYADISSFTFNNNNYNIHIT